MKLDDYGCNTRFAGILLPTRNIMSLIEIMSNFCTVLRDDAFNDYVLDFLNKFLQWLDGMANTQKKYYNIVMIENLHHIIRRLNKQSSHEEWKSKIYELQLLYRSNVDAYVKYVFEYQYPKFGQFYAKMQNAIKSGDFGTLSMQSDFSFKSFDKMVKNTFGNFTKGCSYMYERMKKHFTSEEELYREMWKELGAYVDTMYDEMQNIVGKYYENEKLEPTKEEVQSQYDKTKT